MKVSGFNLSRDRQLSRRQLLHSGARFGAYTSLFYLGGCAAQGDQSALISSRSAGRYISVPGGRVYVEERGEGLPVFMAAGGLNQVETLRPLAEKLAEKYHVITWDRANLGRADVAFSGPRDLDMWSDQLAGLIQHFDTGPAYLIGASSGARVAYTTALNYPQLTRGLMTYLTTGGGDISERLAQRYYFDYADLAEEGGMEAVASSPYYAERIVANPDNLDRLMSYDPSEFAATMRQWGSGFSNDDIMIGLDAQDSARLKAQGTPVAIVQGCEGDGAHRKDQSELYARVTGAKLIPTPAGYCEEAETGVSYGVVQLRPEVPESPAFRGYEMISAIPDVIGEFIVQTESGYEARGLGRDAYRYS